MIGQHLFILKLCTTTARNALLPFIRKGNQINGLDVHTCLPETSFGILKSIFVRGASAPKDVGCHGHCAFTGIAQETAAYIGPFAY